MTALNAETREALRLAVDQRRRELEELPARDPLHPEPWHGTAWAYREKKCRCDRCRAAARDDKRRQRARNPDHHRELWRAAHARRRARQKVPA